MAAAQLVKLSATPYSIKYAGGPGQGNIRLQSDIIADCALGPLRSLLLKTQTDADWSRLPHGPLLSVYGVVESGQGDTFQVIFNGAGALRQLSAGFVAIVAATATLVELRFNHSLGR